MRRRAPAPLRTVGPAECSRIRKPGRPGQKGSPPEAKDNESPGDLSSAARRFSTNRRRVQGLVCTEPSASRCGHGGSCTADRGRASVTMSDKS